MIQFRIIISLSIKQVAINHDIILYSWAVIVVKALGPVITCPFYFPISGKNI